MIIIKNNVYEALETNMPIVYPNNNNATYTSLVNFSSEKFTNRQRWYRYKEGYSIQFVKNIIEKYSSKEDGIILDPFVGSGSTIIGANELNKYGIGFETNPFSYFLSKCKLSNYNRNEIVKFEKSFKYILTKSHSNIPKEHLPKLSISNKVFQPEVENYYMKMKWLINHGNFSDKIRNLLLLGWLSCLELVSNYRKAGNGLKKRKSSKNLFTSEYQVHEKLKKYYTNILNDLINTDVTFKSDLKSCSALNLKKYIKNNSIQGIIFSPPYANSFDYTEIYKLELWFGDFVKNYNDMKQLRKNSLRSHLNGLSSKQSFEGFISTPILDKLINKLESSSLWNKKIPIMLKVYFNQMFEILNQCYEVLKYNGFCSIVVGNSSYGGVIFPTDLLISRYAKEIGFTVDTIKVDRYLVTSSQQYNITKSNKKYLRESIICLTKKKK